MRYNQMGNTGLFVSELCLGTMTFGAAVEGSMWGAIAGLDQAGADEIVRRSVEAGINFIDTADVYSNGVSEQILGQSIRNLGLKRSDVVIATKAYGAMGSRPNDKGASRGHIMDAVEGSLSRLGTDHIDLYQIHADDSITPIDETLRALGAAQARLPRPGQRVERRGDAVCDKLPVGLEQRDVVGEIDARPRHRLALERVAVDIDDARQQQQAARIPYLRVGTGSAEPAVDHFDLGIDKSPVRGGSAGIDDTSRVHAFGSLERMAPS